MQLIKKQELNKIIKENFNCEFAIKHDGLYLIEIIASCKSWKQNLKKLRSFFKDDDLTIKIDEIEFPKLNGKRGLFDGEVAWNGNNLNGFFKTNIFVVNLKRGDHTIQFLNNQKPYLQSIKILKAENVEKITYIPTENNPAQDGDRRQWMNIILVDLPLKNLLIKAKANKHSRDSDDIKLIIDNKIQHNTESKLHKYWYWRGRALSGEEKEFNKEVNLPKGLHYIELWADRMPFLYRVEMELGNMDVEQDRKIIQQYDMYKGVGGKENYNRFDNEIKEAVDFWNNVFAKQEYPPKELLDYNLVKAMIYKESRIGYYKSEYYKAYPDVMQVGDTNNPALNSLRGVSGYDANEFVSKNKKDHISYNFPEEWLPVKVENPKESIFWGVRWLYNKAQKYYGAGVDYNNPPFDREWKPWEQAIIDYNGSPKKYEYQKEIWEIYKNGVDPDGNILWKKNDSGFSLIKMLIVIGLLISSSLIWLYFLVKVNNLIDNCVCAETAVLSEISRNTQYGEFNYSAEEHELIRAIFLRDLEQYKKDKYHYGDVFKNTIDECQKSNCDLEYIITGYYDDLVKYTRSNKQFLDAVSMFDFMQNVKVRDIDNDGENEIIFIKKDVLNNEYLAIIIIDKVENKFQIVEKKVEDMAFGRIDAIDLTGDLQPEIVLLAQNYRWGERLFVYEYSDNKIINIFQHNELVYPIYVFSDSNNNGKMEIKVDGYLYNNGHPVDKNLKDVKVYEYSIEENDFILLK